MVTWEKRPLGRTGMQITPLGIGGAYLGRQGKGHDEQAAVETVLCGLELGINLIDTSGGYIGGESERFIGLALEEWFRRGNKREDLILSTKTGTRRQANQDYSYDGTMRSVETSLSLLKTDYIDILHVHDPNDLGPVLAPGGALNALQALKAQGVIRAIGLGCRPHEFHQRCIATGEFDVSLTFYDFNLADQTAETGVLQPAAARGVGVLNGTPTMNGLLTDRDPLAFLAQQQEQWARTERDLSPKDRERLWQHHEQQIDRARRARLFWDFCQARGLSLLALNLQYCLREPRISSTLIGFSRPARVKEDVTACFAPIPPETWDELHEEFGL